MTVSVIIPVRDGERYLEAATASALGQTVAPHEVILVDDGSTDATPAVIAGFGSGVRSVRIEPSGIAAALNRGVALATGSVLAFLDADDLWELDKLEHQLAALDAEPGVDAVFGLVRQFVSPDADAATTASVWVPPDPVPGLQKSALLVRREAFDRVGPFDEAVTAGDFVDWWARAIGTGIRYAMPGVLVAHRRIHGANNGIMRRHEQAANNLDVLKGVLDRRRATGGT